MSTDRTDHSLAYTIPFQLTKKIHRTVPPELSPERPENSAKGKVIVITGGGTGIGAAAAKIWTQAGATGVVIAGRRQEVLDKTVKELQAFKKEDTKIFAVATDITKEADTENLFASVKSAFGRTADVVLANAGFSKPGKPHEQTSETWWKTMEINLLGLHNTAVSFIRSQTNPNEPGGTFIAVGSGMAGLNAPTHSSYSISKLAGQRYLEYLDLEYPTLRVFYVLPGIVATDMQKEVGEAFEPYAKDQAELSGALALYLASSRADYLKGSMTSINYDIGEMEEHKEEIEKGLLKIKWISPLPINGGSGF
ncbi:hypothetical protein BCR34DRAFT_576965 [Clohesyomyces aquaticus]|uniref:NAD(P)-binding protein n=1 Tax=Clohesyomyces aquaticus TaxID=1231657 RepID=A0A1Y1YL70_9PLEO|nr:hypothetical protein BCR34DRAFT_576965 [Clohesyomyces aquaticus]